MWTGLGFTPTDFGFYDQIVSQSAPTGWFTNNSAARVRAVNDWVLGNESSQGFVLRQVENGSQGTAYLSKFRSVEYSDSSYRPSLYQVTYDSTVPTATGSGYQGAYRVGDTVTVTMRVTAGSASSASQVRSAQICINGASGDPNRYHGLLGWFKSDPGADWIKQGAPAGDGYFAYNVATNPIDYGSDHIVPDLSSFTTTTGTNYREVTVRYKIDDDYGNVQDNDRGGRVRLDS